MKLADSLLLFVLLPAALAAPTPQCDSLSFAECNKLEITDYFGKLKASMKIVKTTKTKLGQTIDWIPLESQGEIAQPPPKLKPIPSNDTQELDAGPLSELEMDGAELGPKGTVPIVLPNLEKIDFNTTTLDDLLSAPAHLNQSSSGLEKRRGITGGGRPHPPKIWRATSGQNAKAFGAEGVFSLFRPAVEPGDYSVMNMVLEGKNRLSQFVEVGLEVSSRFLHDDQLHLYVCYLSDPTKNFCNTVGPGWKQVDWVIYPRSIFPRYSEVGGRRVEIRLKFELFGGNWWLWVKDRWIGYYPADLFRNTFSPSETSLSDSAGAVNFGGAVLDYQETSTTTYTTTDMGSGQCPSARLGRSAYIRNIRRQTRPAVHVDGADDPASLTDYDGSARLYADWGRYGIEGIFPPPFAPYPFGYWRSHLWLGGGGTDSRGCVAPR